MSKRSFFQSALLIGPRDDGDDDAAVLVVGGQGGNCNEAALLTNRPPHAWHPREPVGVASTVSDAFAKTWSYRTSHVGERARAGLR